MSGAFIDTLWTISEHIEPNLEVYVRLSAVNKSFYHVFTSDRLWKRINPYGLESEIFHHFMKSSRPDRLLAHIYWKFNYLSGLEFSNLRKKTKNMYVQAALYRSASEIGGGIWDPPIQRPRPFMFAAASCKLYSRASEELRSDCDFYLACGMPSFPHYQGRLSGEAHQHFRGASKESVIKLIKSRLYYDDIDEYLKCVVPDLAKDLDVIAAAGHKAKYLALQMPEDVFKRLAKESPEFLTGSIGCFEESITKKYPHLVTKEALMALKPNSWKLMLYHIDREWLQDLEFMKVVISNAETFIRFPSSTEFSTQWIEEMCKVFSTVQFLDFKYHEDDYDNVTHFSDDEIKCLKRQGRENYLTLQYYSETLDPESRKKILSHFTETELIEKALKTQITIHRCLVSPQILTDREWALKLVKHNYQFYSDLNEEFKSEPVFFEALFERQFPPGKGPFDAEKDQRRRELDAQFLDMSSLPDRWADDRASIERILRSDRVLNLPFKENTALVIAGDSDLMDLLLSEDRILEQHHRYIVETFGQLCSLENAKKIVELVPTYFGPENLTWVARALKRFPHALVCQIALQKGLCHFPEFLEDPEVLVNSIKNSSYTIKNAPESVRNDPERLVELAHANISIIHYLEPEMQSKVMKLLTQKSEVYSSDSEEEPQLTPASKRFRMR